MFPARRCPATRATITVTTQNLDVVRIDEARSLLLVSGAVPGAKNGHVVDRHGGQAPGRQGVQAKEQRCNSSS